MQSESTASQCEYWETRFNGMLITRGSHAQAVTVLTQLASEGIKAELVKVFPS
jgi:hypothetical protein